MPNRFIAFACSILLFQSLAVAQITTQRVPKNGLAPQAAVDSAGHLHLIYFEGDASKGDIFYVRSDDEGATFTTPIRANSQPGSALVIGSVRSPQLAVGRLGRVFVAWNGSSVALPKPRTALDNKTPMLFARLNDAGAAFEPQRNLITQHAGIDGGGSIAADSDGNVYVAWHAPKDSPGEADRWVWIARSKDDGKTFAPEIAANPIATGACGCCGLKIAADASSHVSIAYRTATDTVHRDMVLLTSNDFGQTFKPIATDPWNANACVMSTASIVGNLAAWETRGQIQYAKIDENQPKINDIPGRGDRKHPVIAINKAGDYLIVWAEGTGWNKGGRIAWQLFDATGQPKKSGSTDGLPVWSQPAVYAKKDGSFGIIY